MIKTTILRFLPRLSTPGYAGHPSLAKTSVIETARRHLCDEGINAMAENRKNELKSRLVWVDLEMTGLDVDKCHILEMACLVTDGDLNVVAEAPNLIIHQPDERLNEMDEWCTTHHTDSGLVAAVKASKVSVEQAEYEMLAFIRKHTLPNKCPLAGNTVHEDKKFLAKYMPQFTDHLHYRIVDVSTIKELCRRWYPQQFKEAPWKKASHRALDDITESIKELKFYRRAIFK